MPLHFRAALAAAALTVLALPSTATPGDFGRPVAVTQGPAYQAAEPSIRVDAAHPKQRIWVAAPSGIGANTRSLPATPENGDLFWSSDDDGKTWRFHSGPAGVGSPTILGGGDTDVATGFGPDTYGTGLTLANITLAASCAEGEDGSWNPNPLSVLNSPDDRQWIDTYEDAPPPPGAPQFVLTYGNFAEGQIYFNQVFAPSCAWPLAPVNLKVTIADCILANPDCYQWPGNVAVDERTGDVYVTYNTQGDPDGDKVIVARINHGASDIATQEDVVPFVVASDRPDTFDSFTVVAVDRGGNVYVAWTERHGGGETNTMLSVSTDRGSSWSKPVQVNRHPSTTTFPWLVAGDPGRIDLVYYGTSARGPSPETVPETSRWQVFMAQSLNALSSKRSFAEQPATGYMHQGSICTSGTGCAAGTRDLLDFFQVDVDRQGWANIAYTDNLNTPPAGTDAHQEWIMFVQQRTGHRLYR